MSTVICIISKAQEIFDKVRTSIDFIGPLLLRIYIVPVFWVASNNKWNPFDSDSSLDSVIQWFGNTEWGLGLPFPTLMAYMAWGTEYFGAILLALGLATRWISIPLMCTMIVAAVTVHWQHGWQAVHDLSSPHASANAGEAIERLSRAKDILKEHGNYEWLTEHGNFIVSNNGIEWAATYFVILLALFVTGGGKFVSVDYWLAKKCRG
ncbi:MAG: DoxX family protein [Gammaproteobacteria bacterium]|nr:DoxX family protein [Gammaproteobacteria bacterium]